MKPETAPAMLRAARLVHPFPSAVDAGVVAALATVDGSRPFSAGLLAASMFGLQAAIGIANDLADIERDRGRSEKPIPAGLVTVRTARILAVTSAALGLGIALALGPELLLVAAIGLAIGLSYDLRLRGTPWSWLPFALGIPLLPLYAWLGGSGCLPPAGGLVVSLAVLAGAQLALINALADAERDAAAGLVSIATALGPERAWLVAATLSLAIAALAGGTLIGLGGRGAGLAGVAAGIGLVGLALGLSHGSSRRLRQAGWSADCIGLAVLAAGWVAAVAGSWVLPVPPC